MNEQLEHKTDGKAGGERAYVLRMWPAGDDWQASLQEVKFGRRIGFSNLEALFNFLMDVAEHSGRPADATPPA